MKTRLGFSRVEEWHNWLKFLLEQEIAVLTIHLRTKKEMSKVAAHFELIPEILALRDEVAPETLIQINGDIKTREQGLALWRKYPKIDGIMIGRGVFENPFCFEKNPPEIPRTSSDYLDLLELQLDLFEKYSRELEKRRFEPLKRFFKIYVREFSGASELRAKLMETKSVDEVREILKDFRSAAQK